MNTKVANRKTTSGATEAKNGTSSNGMSAPTLKRKKSINERWIEKYGVDDSELAIKTRKMWQMIYDAHNKPKS